jgi:hypothetical protein
MVLKIEIERSQVLHDAVRTPLIEFGAPAGPADEELDVAQGWLPFEFVRDDVVDEVLVVVAVDLGSAQGCGL